MIVSYFFFRLYNFPTQKKKPEDRLKWIKLINRTQDDSKGSTSKLWEPKKNSRVCSRHFKDGMPTQTNPYPTEELGYTTNNKRSNDITGVSSRRIILKKSPPLKKKKVEDNAAIDIETNDDIDFSTDSVETTGYTDEFCFSLFTLLFKMMLNIMMFACVNVPGLYFMYTLYQNEKTRCKHYNIVIKNLIDQNRKLRGKVLKLEK